MIYKSTPDEQHPSNATSNSILVNKMAKVPLISNTFLGVAWGAFLGQSPTMYSGFCKWAANHGPAWLWLLQTSWCGGLQAIIGLVNWFVSAPQVQTSRACCLTFLRSVRCQKLEAGVLHSKSLRQQHPLLSNTFWSARWGVARQGFYCIHKIIQI